MIWGNYYLWKLQRHCELPYFTMTKSKILLAINLVHHVQIQTKSRVEN
jgi:hypothetical protein